MAENLQSVFSPLKPALQDVSKIAYYNNNTAHDSITETESAIIASLVCSLLPRNLSLFNNLTSSVESKLTVIFLIQNGDDDVTLLRRYVLTWEILSTLNARQWVNSFRKHLGYASIFQSVIFFTK